MQMKTQENRDNDVREAVLRQLEWDPQVTSNDIQVASADSVVTLTGFVGTYAEKYAAEKATQAVSNVWAIVNDIEVKPINPRTDAEIARDVIQAMRINVLVPAGIKAIVLEGFVTLEGVAEWDFQRRCAESCACNVTGVRGVVSQIQLEPKMSAAHMCTKIKEALRRNAELDARWITVSALDSTVHLFGRVRSRSEREEAERAAWAAPGVAEVIDHISVIP